MSDTENSAPPGGAAFPASTAPPGTQAIVRAVRLLKAVGAGEDASSLGDLAGSLGLAKPTVHRMLAALESEGLITRDGTGVRLGSAVVTLGAQALAGSNLRARARTHLERLAAKSGETATLEIPSGDRMLILDEVRGGQLVGAHAEVGTQWPMYATSTGKAFLASLPETQLARWLSRPRTRFTERTLTRERDLRAALLAVSERGFAISQEELEMGYSAVGAVLPGGVAALSLGGPSDRMGENRLAELGVQVRIAAAALAREVMG